ncbi:hypothetical protein VTN77DRAFT_1809 [Rasamsonia byssochlamydoides]|uniref:uncharacterized protein n=1 Tax=Rasamsonia byssochlamydoides TaxID=89139 RepID=UPI00374430E5
MMGRFRSDQDRASKVPGEVPSLTGVVQRRCLDRGNAVGFDPKNSRVGAKKKLNGVADSTGTLVAEGGKRRGFRRPPKSASDARRKRRRRPSAGETQQDTSWDPWMQWSAWSPYFFTSGWQGRCRRAASYWKFFRNIILWPLDMSGAVSLCGVERSGFGQRPANGTHSDEISRTQDERPCYYCSSPSSPRVVVLCSLMGTPWSR